jgi:hypothetical protein
MSWLCVPRGALRTLRAFFLLILFPITSRLISC